MGRMSADDLLGLVDESGLIFAGAVVVSEAPEADAAPETAPHTFMVKVGEVLRSTDVLRRLAGGAVTVVSEQGPPEEVDTSWVFFTECISLGESVVARELGRWEGTPDSVRAIVEAVGGGLLFRGGAVVVEVASYFFGGRFTLADG